MRRLSTKNITEEISRDCYGKRNFVGILPRDMLPSIYSYPSSLIINTHPRGAPGEHWLAL